MNTAKIIALTQPTDTSMTVDDFIAYAARVSNPSNQNNALTAQKLIRYLAKNSHWSPFEMVHVVMEINTTRDIARQILRHRSFSFQEFSQRYADPTNDLGFTAREARLQDPKNRQNSVAINPGDGENVANLMSDWHWQQESIIDAAKSAYDWAIQSGIAKEQARAVLPEGLTNSRMYMAGSLRSWIHYCQLRMGNGTQLEHQEVATNAWYELTSKFPSLKDSLQDI
jgi:thymidylate synthase (FAD)